jgi:hypothetical protein
VTRISSIPHIYIDSKEINQEKQHRKNPTEMEKKNGENKKNHHTIKVT